MIKNFLFILLFFSFVEANSLQKAINNSQSGSIIKLSSGIYTGNLVINKPITIIGIDKNVIIQGLNKDTIITINSSNVILKNLTIKSSGKRLENLDAAIRVNKAENIEINSCRIIDSLFGIDFNMVNNSKIINNYIESKDLPISLKGDALMLYYSNNNLIENNELYKTRDVRFSYSNKNIYAKNYTQDSRVALHLLKSSDNTIDENHFKFNSVGMIFAGAKNTEVKNNTIQSGKGAAGIGVLVKGVSDFKFHNNIVSFNSKAFYIDAKHNEQNIKRFIQNNEISYNKEAFHFHGAIKQNMITKNVIVGNLDDVVKSVRGNQTSSNIVQNNYWDQYAGFDTDRDNIGDSSYKVLQYADRLWHYNNKIKFFYAAPVISILNFVLSVAPFIEPVIILEDKKPVVDLDKMFKD